MRRIFQLAALFFLAISVGCAAQQATPRAAAFKPEDVVGAWTLADDENCTFDVRLSPKSTAISNWSKGNLSAQGESGRWRIEGDRVVIDYDDGWRDTIVSSAPGRFRKESFAPNAPRDGAPTNATLALRTPAAFARWVGVYEMPVAESKSGRGFFVSIQSNHLAWKSIDEVRVGSWWIVGDALRIRWANGWLDEIQPLNGGYRVRSWKPGTTLDSAGNPEGAPTNTGGARRLE